MCLSTAAQGRVFKSSGIFSNGYDGFFRAEISTGLVHQIIEPSARHIKGMEVVGLVGFRPWSLTLGMSADSEVAKSRAFRENSGQNGAPGGT
jgi:hypothetical protein